MLSSSDPAPACIIILPIFALYRKNQFPHHFFLQRVKVSKKVDKKLRLDQKSVCDIWASGIMADYFMANRFMAKSFDYFLSIY